MSIKQYFCVNIPANEQRLDPALVNEISSLTSADDDGEIVVHAEERVGLGDRHGSMHAGAGGRVDGAPANTYTSGSRPKDWISVTKIGNEPPSFKPLYVTPLGNSLQQLVSFTLFWVSHAGWHCACSIPALTQVMNMHCRWRYAASAPVSLLRRDAQASRCPPSHSTDSTACLEAGLYLAPTFAKGKGG